MATKKPETSAKIEAKIGKSATLSRVEALRLPPPTPWAVVVKFNELPQIEKMAIFMTTIGTEIDEIYISFNLSDEQEEESAWK
jgi:hypothetical protein